MQWRVFQVVKHPLFDLNRFVSKDYYLYILFQIVYFQYIIYLVYFLFKLYVEKVWIFRKKNYFCIAIERKYRGCGVIGSRARLRI